MKKTFDNKFLVFQVAEGPKIIIESLDTQGKDGWEDKIVVFLKREMRIEDPNPKEDAKAKVDELWEVGE